MRLTCDDLRKFPDSVTVSDSNQVARLYALATNDKFIHLPEYDGVDARICCVFWDMRNQTVMTIEFAQPPLMMVNGKVYERGKELFLAVVAHLPGEYLKD